MSHKHQQLLRTIFRDPASGNIHWREIESLSGARIRVKLNHVEGILHRPHHGNTLDRNAIQNLREFLARAGATASLYEDKKDA